MLFGMWPAWRLSRPETPRGLLASGQIGATRRHHGVIKGLVVAEIALSFVLLIGGMLLLESVIRFSSAPLGFDPVGLVFERVRLPVAKYSTPIQRGAVFGRVRRSCGAVPGV